MDINLNDYRVIKQYVDNWVKLFPEKCSTQDITELTVGLNCPLIIVLYFFKYNFPERKDIMDEIETVKRFYQYENIIEVNNV